MPYVEGFGTWPFGEEWLLEAIAACYLPLIDAARAPAERGDGGVATVGVTPVLADQLALPEVGERFLRLHARRARASATASTSRGWSSDGQHDAADALRALGARLRVGGGRVRAPRRRPARRAAAPARRGRDRALDLDRHARGAAAARDRAGRAASARDRHRLAPGALRRLERRLLAAGVRLPARARGAARGAPACAPSASTRPRARRRARPARAGRTPAGRGRGADRLGDDRAGLGRARLSRRPGLPRLPRATRSTACAPWANGGGALRPRARRRARAREHARDFVARVAERAATLTGPRAGGPALVRLRARHRAARPLVVRGARRGWRRCSRRPARRASRSRRCPRRSSATSRSSGRWSSRAGAAARTCAPGTRPRSPSSSGRRGEAELRAGRRARRGPAPPATRGRRPASAPRASCSRSSRATGPSWRTRELAGDYPEQRVRSHARRVRARRSPRCARGRERLPRDAGRGDTRRPRRRPPARPRPAPATSAPLLAPASPWGRRAPRLTSDAGPDALLGVPAADRGRPRAPRAQALREPRRPGRRGARADPRPRGVAGRGDRRGRAPAPRAASRCAPPSWASSSPGSST